MLKRQKTFWIFIYLALVVMGLFNLLPFYWMLSSSFKTEGEVSSYPATLFPQVWTLGAYSKIWFQEKFVYYFINSLIVSMTTATFSSLVGAFAAYGFSRFRFKGKTLTMTLFLASQMIPGVLLVGPYFKMLSLVGLYNTLLGLILSQITITLPFSIWMLKGYMDTVPVEIDQAAMVDGASRTRTFLMVVLPGILPGLVATIIFAFLLSWGDLLWALCLINAKAKQTLTLGITQLVGEFRTEWSTIMAATMIATMVPAVLYLLLQNFLIKGFTESAVKG
ncbi:MAG: carbohydrate ABC transporter permease [Deltaproteobacteria bacterium]|nr:carbohydrate ABC transporter permease [Deltaproteobacteria bacterium]